MSRSAMRPWAWRAGVAGVLLALFGWLGTSQLPQLTGTARGSAALEERPAPCLPGEAVPLLDSPHIPPVDADGVEYHSLPPTSGPHYSFVAAPGIYDAPVAEGLTVHAMEHGHVVIQYAPATPDPVVAALARVAKEYGGDTILAPYPPLADGIALTAWGRIDLLDEFDEQRIRDFIGQLSGRYNHGWMVGTGEC